MDEKYHRRCPTTRFRVVESKEGSRDHTWTEDWKAEWFNAGWEPAILSLADAKWNENYQKVKAYLEPHELGVFENNRVYRWLAMANVVSHRVQQDGGWMSEVDVFPLNIFPSDGFTLPNDGQLTLHNSNGYSMISGSTFEWERMVRHILIILTFNVHNPEFSYHLLMEKVFLQLELAIVRLDDVRLGYYSVGLLAVNCSKYTSDVKAVHFSDMSRSNAFHGGWLESIIRYKYKPNVVNLKFRHRDEAPVFIDPETSKYKNAGDVRDIQVILDGNPIGSVHDVLDAVHRTDLAVSFMQKIQNQCYL